jgi:hypothetical protein
MPGKDIYPKGPILVRGLKAKCPADKRNPMNLEEFRRDG